MRSTILFLAFVSACTDPGPEPEPDAGAPPVYFVGATTVSAGNIRSACEGMGARAIEAQADVGEAMKACKADGGGCWIYVGAEWASAGPYMMTGTEVVIPVLGNEIKAAPVCVLREGLID